MGKNLLNNKSNFYNSICNNIVEVVSTQQQNTVQKNVLFIIYPYLIKRLFASKK